MNKKVLVTGGCGFIGSHLVEKLIRLNYEVTVIDNLLRGNKLTNFSLKNSNFINGDVRDVTKINEITKKCDYVFHLAAYLGVEEVANNPKETMDVESIGTYNIVNAAIKNSCEKIIYISTSGVYGKVDFDKAVDENFLVSPASSYSIAKRFNEIYMQSIYKDYQIDTFSLRYFNVYGPRQDTRMVVPKFFDSTMKNKPITVFGNGKQTRDFTFIDDTVSSTIKIAEICKGNEIINISKGDDIQIIDVANKICKITRSSSEVLLVDTPQYRYDFDVDKRWGNSDKLFSLTGYKPDTSLDDGLSETYKYLMGD